MAITPWPSRTATASLAATIAELSAALGEDDQTVVARLGATASALVEREAPGAPQAVRDEALIRCAGWLREAPAAGVRMESAGEISTSFTPSATGALRASGALALIARWKIRRAGAIG